MNKKYELTDETMDWLGHTFRRIRYSDGTKGGWLESYNNLSQEGKCRVLDVAKVYGNARVFGNATVYGTAKVYGDAEVYGAAKVYRYADVYGSAKIFGSAEVCGIAKIFGSAEVCGDAEISGEHISSGIIRESDSTRKAREAKEAAEKKARDLELARKAAEKKAVEAREAKKVRDRREVVEEIIYMIEHCPRGEKHALLSDIASLMLLFSSSERDKILGLYEVWREKDGGVFSPPREKIEDMIGRLERSGQTPSQGSVTYSQQSSSPQGGYSPPSNPRLGDFMDDMKDVRRGQSYRGRFNPGEGGND